MTVHENVLDNIRRSVHGKLLDLDTNPAASYPKSTKVTWIFEIFRCFLMTLWHKILFE